MSIASINSNIAAYYAQANIETAQDEVTSSVARLASGNALVRASDNVAALSIGTGLQSVVSTLKVAQQNTSLGNSLLQVADGALAQIQSILQQQASLAAQANSGSLSDTQRGFLDQQFQALSTQINDITSQTNFNGVNLLDGSLSGDNPLQNTTIGSTSNDVAATVTGIAAQTDVTAFSHFVLDSTTSNDTTFYGNLSSGVFTVTEDTGASHGFNVSYTLNGSTYTGDWVANTNSMTNSLTLDNGQGKIQLAMNTASVLGGASSTDRATLQTELTSAFAGAKAFGIHPTLSTLATDSSGATIVGSAITTTTTAGTLLQGVTGANVTMSSVNFNGKQMPSIGGFTSSTLTGNGTGLTLSVVINGQTYTTKAATATPTNIAGANNIFVDGNGILKFYLNGDASNNPNEYLEINLSGDAQTVNLTTTQGINNFLSTLNNTFGGGGNGGLNFQVGTAATDTIGVTINNAGTSSIGLAGTDVLSQGDAATAITAVNNALNTVTAIRASVGALESQFNYASANLSSSIQNQDSARSQLLDTNIATESTNFATEQVKLQAGISVLAQANTAQQNLLKLIQG